MRQQGAPGRPDGGLSQGSSGTASRSSRTAVAAQPPFWVGWLARGDLRAALDRPRHGPGVHRAQLSGTKEKKTKTRQKRRIALDAHTVALLRTQLDEFRANCRALDIPFRSNASVFSNDPAGAEPLQPRSVSQRYRRLAQRLQLRSTRLHALRHYSATELIAAGVDLRTVAGRLGHGSGGATTPRNYAAWVDEADHHAANTIAGIVPRPDPSKREPRSPYEKIAAELRKRITVGEPQPGDHLPTVKELATKYGVSAGTAHRAIDLLRSEGAVNVTRGRRAQVLSAG